MKRILLVALACGAVSAVLLADAPRISRFAMSKLEAQLDGLFASDAFTLEGNTRGVYLDGYGAVFTTMVSVRTPTPNPFNNFSQKDIAAVHNTKLKELPALREKIRQALLIMASSGSLDGVREKEQVVCGVTLFYFKWEDTSGLPRQILMQAEKQQLLSVETGRVPRTELVSLLKVQEQ